MTTIESLLLGSGTPRDDIYIERFTVSDATSIGAESDEACAEAELMVSVGGETRSIRAKAGETVLEAARRTGCGQPRPQDGGGKITVRPFG